MTLLVLAALPLRLVNLDVLAAKPDEGIRLEQLFLMSVGFRPIRDIFASQGPLSLDVTYPLFALLGGTLLAARLAVGLYSLAELAACYLLARELGGRPAAVVGGLVLVASPVFLKNSRTALVEVPALLPATLAVLAAARYARGGRPGWLVASALLLALALLIKPIVLAAGLPVLLLLLGRSSGRWRGLLAYGAVAGGFVVAVVLLYGPTQLYDQVVRYRVGSAQAEGWSLAENLDLLGGELVWESTAGLVLAGVSLPLALLAGRWRAFPAVAWLLASAGLLLAYSPLQPKHVVIALPPAALAIGLGVGGALRASRPVGPRLRLVGRSLPLVTVVGVALLAWYLVGLPGLVARGRQVAAVGLEARADNPADDVSLLSSLTGPADFILVDEPVVAYLSRRRVPPNLVDPTIYRLRSGTLSAGEVIEASQRFEVRAMLLWTDGLRELRRFADWVDANFRAAKVYERRNGKDRTLYLRNDADFGTARPIVGAGLSPIGGAEFSGQLRLAAAGLEQAEARAGTQVGVTSEWVAIGPIGVDYRLVAALNDRTGQPVAQLERSLAGGSVGTSGWQPGRWIVRSFLLTVPPRTPPGDYTVALALYDSKARQRLPLRAGGPGPDEVSIATLRVR